jgi:hypothetical protein
MKSKRYENQQCIIKIHVTNDNYENNQQRNQSCHKNQQELVNFELKRQHHNIIEITFVSSPRLCWTL